MLVGTHVVGNLYRDSVSLMRMSTNLCDLPGITQAYCLMATQTNLELLRETALLGESIEAAANDILIVVEASDQESLDRGLEAAKEALDAKAVRSNADEKKDALAPSMVAAIHGQAGSSNLALISTPGPYAAAEAFKALAEGLNVMIFSDNVSLADEVLLKQKTKNSDLLVLGPDCGTAIIDGIPLGFANNVRRGPIGVVGASGTGLQQVASLVDHFGAGVSQVIGVGGRDLSLQVGGITTRKVLNWFKNDADTQVIVIVSKSVDEKIGALISADCLSLGKPVVICLLGEDHEKNQESGMHVVSTLEDAARKAVEVAGFSVDQSSFGNEDFAKLVRRSGERKYLRGLYCGGTFCLEAFQLLQKKLHPLSSNVAYDVRYRMKDPWSSSGHVLIDLGDDIFTRGRPHPMIDHRVRNERLRQEAMDPEAAVILFDVVLGTGANDSPVEAMAPILKEIQGGKMFSDVGPLLCAFVCGTKNDPQSFSRQCAALEKLGVNIFRSSTESTRAAARILETFNE
ncbi:MAG: hypothetical protein VX884_03050 [Pseudomonadota bacterium]|nr:hypothetical protein [Pseudomonadota bacterium]